MTKIEDVVAESIDYNNGLRLSVTLSDGRRDFVEVVKGDSVTEVAGRLAALSDRLFRSAA